MEHSRPLTPRLLAAAAVAAMFAVTACSETHLARRETVTSEAGNAKSVNTAQQVVDTMPPAARRTAHTTGSARMVKAIERYDNPPDPGSSTGKKGDGAVENSESQQE